jgi:molecular chaperone GrpE
MQLGQSQIKLTVLSREKYPLTCKSYQRLPRTIGSIQRKLLTTLQKRDVYPIVIPEKEAVDVNLCRIIESENRDDLPERSLVKTLKTGYMNGDKVLRSAEVIVAKSTN